MPTIADKRRAFRKLHDTGCFVLPNPWDIGSACYLQHLGYKALATTSAGFAFTRALPDGGVPRDMMLAHIREIVEATDLPVNADFGEGFAHDPAGVAESVRLCGETSVAGLSVEDATGDGGEPLYDLDTAVERMRSARAAIDKAGGDVLLVGRCECFLVGKPDIAETVARLKAYSSAGADCLYAPGIRTREEVAAVVEAAAPKPVSSGLMSGTTERGVAPIRPALPMFMRPIARRSGRSPISPGSAAEALLIIASSSRCPKPNARRRSRSGLEPCASIGGSRTTN